MKRDHEIRDADLEKLFDRAGLESPSPDFTENVMASVRIEPEFRNVSFKPIIGKRGWILISSIAVLLVLLAVMINPSEISWWSSIRMPDLQFPDLFESKTTQLFSDRFQFQIPSIILFSFIPILALILSDYMLHKFRDKDLLGIY